MLKELVKLANHLDSKGLVKEADYLDRIIKSADDEPMGMAPSIGVNTEGKTSIHSHRTGEDRCLVWLDVTKHGKKDGKDLFSGKIYWGPTRNIFSEIHSKNSFTNATGEKLKEEVNNAFDRCSRKIMTSNDLNINSAENSYSEITSGSKHMVDFGDKSLILQVPYSDTDWMTIQQVEKALGTFTGN
tara:strand:- start:8736 stop:9293 length:558 start_codon:yes stop_codon:yes gene_type:complete